MEIRRLEFKVCFCYTAAEQVGGQPELCETQILNTRCTLTQYFRGGGKRNTVILS